MLTGNRIWKVRLADVGTAAGKTVEAHALTGVLVRGSGIKKDLRILGYGCPIELGFDVVTGVKGDCLDRYLVRLNECLESARIIQQCMKSLKVFNVLHNYRETISNLHDRKVGTPDKYEFGTNMESMIHYFKLVTEGCTLPKQYLSISNMFGDFPVFKVYVRMIICKLDAIHYICIPHPV